jgi:hypothetical protein
MWTKWLGDLDAVLAGEEPELRQTLRDTIIGRAQQPEYTWLRSEDPAHIGDVIASVRALRAQSKNGLRDREVFSHFHNRVNNVNPEDVDPEDTRLYLIVSALMGGSARGKLPF